MEKTALTKTRKSREITDWKSLEDAVQDDLILRQRKEGLLFHRFYDTRSAGAYLPSQPADFGVLRDGRWTYIEAKYASSAETLRSVFSAAVSDHQLATAKLAERAGGSYWFLFYSASTKLFEIWPGAYCASRRDKGLPLEVARRYGVYDTPTGALDIALTRSSIRLTYQGIQ